MPVLSLRHAATAIAVMSCPFSSVVCAGDDPFADAVISYVAGTNPASGYTNPATALGSPERFTGELISPGVVSPFNPAFGTGEIVSIGVGGSIVLRFNTPVTNDPANPFGIDLIIFGNSGFIDSAFPSGIAGSLFADGGDIQVSADGVNWFPIGIGADGLFPTLGYLDSGPYDSRPGSQPADFTRPVDPALQASDFVGLSCDEIVALYGESGGGKGVDIGPTGLSAISFVRITNPFVSSFNIEIDAVSDAAPATSPADLSGDGEVNTIDLGILLAGWSIPATAPACGGSTPCLVDINGDGFVNSLDLGVLLSAWTL